ncbi:hypothetical protein Tco_0507436 [Tanacetum coccineum]
MDKSWMHIVHSYDEWTHHGESCDVSDDSDDDVSFNDEDVGNDNMNGDNDDDDADANVKVRGVINGRLMMNLHLL